MTGILGRINCLSMLLPGFQVLIWLENALVKSIMDGRFHIYFVLSSQISLHEGGSSAWLGHCDSVSRPFYLFWIMPQGVKCCEWSSRFSIGKI